MLGGQGHGGRQAVNFPLVGILSTMKHTRPSGSNSRTLKDDRPYKMQRQDGQTSAKAKPSRMGASSLLHFDASGTIEHGLAPNVRIDKYRNE